MLPLLSLLSLSTPMAHAGPYPEANPGRPSFSDNASPTATGALELEAGAAADPEGFGLNYVLKLGVAEDADLRLGFDHGIYPSPAPGGASLLAKYTLKHPDDRVFGAALAPFASWDFEADQPGYGLYVIGTIPVGRLQVDANLLAEGAYTHAQTLTLDIDPVVTAGVQITDLLSMYLESYAILPAADPDGELGAAVAAGFGIGLRTNLVIDGACDVGLVGLPRWTAQLGFTYGGYVFGQERSKDLGPRRPPGPR